MIHIEISDSDTASACGLTAKAQAPIVNLCRMLLEAGHDPAEPAEAYRGATLCLRIPSIGELARGLKLDDGPEGARVEPQLAATDLEWKQHGDEWRLYLDRRAMGRVVRDGKYPAMWRSIMPDGRLSDMANLSWSKNAVLRSAEREIEYTARSCKRTVESLGK
jgi:hypothetical protein